MNRPAESPPRCTVHGGEKLPAESGGAEALCAEIEAATAQLPTPPTVSVRIVAAHTLAASISVGGRDLPEIKMSRMDRAFDRPAFQRFAQSIAEASAAAR